MTIEAEKARSRGSLAAGHGSGLYEAVSEELSASLETNYKRRQRRREEQACRVYWQSNYGLEAEYASRGGVTWLY